MEIKGRSYSLRDALRDPAYEAQSLVIGIFMTFFDVHTNRIPYPGSISYTELEPVDTYNHPMLDVEEASWRIFASPQTHSTIFITISAYSGGVYSPHLGQEYYVLQIADYDVDCIVPYRPKQNQPVAQGQRFPRFATARKWT